MMYVRDEDRAKLSRDMRAVHPRPLSPMSVLLAALALQAAEPGAVVGLCRFDVAKLSFAGTPPSRRAA